MEQELAFKLQEDQIFYQTQVEIPVTTADFYFPTQPRPLIVFVYRLIHLRTAQMVKDEELRTLPRKKGYGILELFYNNYSDKTRGELYHEVLELRRQKRIRLPNLGLCIW